MRCLDIYARCLQKSPGDHGGHVIGYTRSNKPIYGSQHASNSSVNTGNSDNHSAGLAGSAAKAHPKFTAEDHLDAADAHASEAARATTRAHREGSHIMSEAHVHAYMTSRARDNK